jgi:hypothetical protein
LDGNKQVYTLWKGVKVMRKLVILMLVVGMASVANAALRLSVNGDKDPADSRYYLEPSGTLKLDVWTDADIGLGVYWAIVTNPKAEVTGGTVIVPDPDVGIIYTSPASQSGIPGRPDGTEGRWGSLAVFSPDPGIPAGTVLFDDLIIHCKGGPNDQRVYLVSTADFVGHKMTSLIIHQIPEPMTVALLGFGGLFLLRRRK